MYLVIRQKVFSNYSGYRIYDDGSNKIVMTSTKQTGETDYAVSVQFEPQIMQFSGIALSNAADKTRRDADRAPPTVWLSGRFRLPREDRLRREEQRGDRELKVA